MRFRFEREEENRRTLDLFYGSRILNGEGIGGTEGL